MLMELDVNHCGRVTYGRYGSIAVITAYIPQDSISCPLWFGSGHLARFEEISQNR